MSTATVTLVGEEVACAVAGGAEARLDLAEARLKLATWARRYDRASEFDKEVDLALIGEEIFAWLDSTNRWASLWFAAPGERALQVLVDGIESDDENLLLDAPWELLVGPKGPLAADDLHLFVVYRRIGTATSSASAAFGDFKLMFMAASPGDPGDLGFEAEEAAILDATARLPLHLVVEETGSLEFLSVRLANEGPFEALHLSCHGTIAEKLGPVLVLEDAAGEIDLVTPGRIADGLGPRRPALLFLSACHTAEFGGARSGTPFPGYRDQEPRRDAGGGPNATAPLARQMAEVVPNVVGWDGSVYDADASAFAEQFYRELARGSSVPRGAAMARKALLQMKSTPQGGRHWHLARVYVGAGGGAPLCDNARPRRPRAPAPERVFLDKERGLVPVASPREFVGRRRAIQAMLRAYRAGSVGALIHGMGAIGKSSLAARAVGRLPHLDPVVVFERYDATVVFDRIRDALPAELRRGETDKWRAQVAQDASILAHALESWLTGPFATRPILLIVDDLERILETPRASDEAVSVKLYDRPVLSAVLTAFSRAAGESRLLLTSRYDFRLLDGSGRDLADPLHRVPLQAMKEREQVKQWRAASRIANREGELGDEARSLQTRALRAAGGNPGLQATLTRPILAGELPTAETAIGQIEEFLGTGVPPAKIAEALAAGQAKDKENAVVAIFRRLSFETYRKALTADQARQMTASSFFSPGLPIPTAALEAAGAAFGAAAPATAVARLIGLGLLDDFGEIAGHRHAALNSLARPLADKVEAADGPRLARAAFPALAQTWRADGAFPADARGPEAARLALAGGADPDLLEDAMWAAAAWLDRREGQTRVAFALMVEARDSLPIDHAFTPQFLRLALECAYSLGEAAFRDWALKASLRPCPPTDRVLRRAHAAFDVRRAEAMMDMGEVAGAEALTREALGVFQRLGDEPAGAVAWGQIADVLQARGELDEALRIRREEQLPVYERLGDQRERAVTMGKIADVLQTRGELDEALRIRREEELPVYERLGDQRARAVTMGKIADVLEARGELDEALRIRREEELPVYERLGDQRSRAVTMGQVADVLQARGELDEALRIRREEQLPVYERLGDQRSRAVTMGKIADVLQARGELDEALRIRREEQLPVFDHLGDQRERAVTMGQIADVLQARGELDEALRIRREEQLPVFDRLGDQRSRAVTMGQIADVLEARGELDEALRIREEQLPVFDRLGDQRSKAVTLQKIATALLAADGIAQGRIQDIYDALAEAFAIALRLKIPDGVGEVGVPLAHVLSLGGHKVEALGVLDEAEAAFRKLGQQNRLKVVDQLRQRIGPQAPEDQGA